MLKKKRWIKGKTLDSKEIELVQIKIQNGIETLGLKISDEKLSILLQFIELLIKWNKAYNLTSIRDIDSIVTKHILDSLSIVPYIKGHRILDVGTGAGFPGFPLALSLSDAQFVLLDSNGKKTRFLAYAVASLGITNIEVVQARVENYHPTTRFESIVVRAFSSIDNIIASTKDLIVPQGRLLIMKGAYPASELEKISDRVKVYPLLVPGLEEQRHLVCIEGNASE